MFRDFRSRSIRHLTIQNIYFFIGCYLDTVLSPSLIPNIDVLSFQQESYHVTVLAHPGLARVPVIKSAPVYRDWPASAHAPRGLTSIIVEASSQLASKTKVVFWVTLVVDKKYILRVNLVRVLLHGTGTRILSIEFNVYASPKLTHTLLFIVLPSQHFYLSCSSDCCAIWASKRSFSKWLREMLWPTMRQKGRLRVMRRSRGMLLVRQRQEQQSTFQ